MSDYQGLNDAGRDKLEKLRDDYERVAGEPFETQGSRHPAMRPMMITGWRSTCVYE